MLEAARELFAERGYEATTVRMIAESAGLSPAGVFTTFADKRDILHHVRMAQNAEVRAEAERLAPALTGSACDRVCALVRFLYEAEWPNLPLVIAYIGASYGWSPQTEAAMQSDHRGLFDAIRSLLEQGRAQGELRAELDVDVAVELLFGIYHGNYRNGWNRGWTAAQTADHVERKLRLVFDGFEAGGAA